MLKPAAARKSRVLAKPLDLILPATSANLGPAFDAAALAMKLFLRVRARVAGEFSIRASGRDQELCGRLENNLILKTYREVLASANKTAQPVALTIQNQIPIGKGCGSSASAVLAGVALANHFGRLGWSANRIIGEAARREHHPDNAAACWMGGLAVARIHDESNAQVAVVKPKGKWPLLLAVPDEALSTQEARSILPETYSRADTVNNIQNSMLLLAAFSQGRPELLATALGDRMHQPYRAHLCPLLPAMQLFAGAQEVLGVALSGAGPSVLIFLHPKANLHRVRQKVAAHLRNHSLPAELIATAIFNRANK
jgi:homoserine kinase